MGRTAGLSFLLGLAWHPGQSYCGWLARTLEDKNPWGNVWAGLESKRREVIARVYLRSCMEGWSAPGPAWHRAGVSSGASGNSMRRWFPASKEEMMNEDGEWRGRWPGKIQHAQLT